VACALVVTAIVAPAALAAISVTAITPDYGVGGTTVSCVIDGDFWVDAGFVNADSPVFTLTNGATTITGTTTLWTDSAASVNFTLPAGPQASFNLNASQRHWVILPAVTDTTSLANAFYLYVKPAITTIDPASAAVGSADTVITVNGSNFYTNGGLVFGYRSTVRYNGDSLATTYVSGSQLKATIPAARLTTTGTAQITVWNAPGILIVGGFSGVASNAVTFTIANPVPAMGSINPTSAWAGSVRTDLVLTVNGTNFLNGARIVVSGGEKTNTTFVSATQLTVPLTPADMALPVASLTISVKNPPFPPGTSSAGALPLALQQESTTPTVTIAGADSAWHNTPVQLTFTAADSQSGVQKVQYMSAPAVPAWTDGTAYTVPTSVQGAVTVNVQALDWCNKVGTAQATVSIDTTQPGTEALKDVSVKKGKTANLKYRVSEPANLSPTADVVIKVKRSNGTTAKTFTMDDVPMNSQQTKSFKCNLAKGTYKWYVYATDLAGNAQENIAQAKLKVK